MIKMERMLGERIGERLPDYYPNDKFNIDGITRVKTKPRSSVYRIRIFDKAKGYQDLYAKEYREDLAPNIHEMMGLKEYHGLFLMPKMLDYYDDDENIVLSEGTIGDTLTKSLLRHIFLLDRSLSTEMLLSCSRKMGYAIGSLQNLTNRGILKKIGDLDICLITEIEEENYFKTILKKDLLKDIKDHVDKLKEIKTSMSQYHGDPSPHNILLKDDRVSLLDYSFQDSAPFLDPVLYVVSLELMHTRFGILLRNPLLKMETVFLRAYMKTTKQMWGFSAWALIKTLTYLHFLLMYAKREKTIKKTLVAATDRRYLLKQINDYGRSI